MSFLVPIYNGFEILLRSFFIREVVGNFKLLENGIFDWGKNG